MINTIGTIRFNLRTDKLLKSGVAPIELIYSLSQQRKYFNTGLKVMPDYWDALEQRILFINSKSIKKLSIEKQFVLTEVEVNELNNKLNTLSYKIAEIEAKFKANKEPFNSEMVVNQLKVDNSALVKVEEAKGLVYSYIDRYIESHREIRELASLKIYGTLRNYLREYESNQKIKVAFENIDYQFFSKFQKYLLSLKKTDKEGAISHRLNNVTIAKLLKTLKTFIGYAKKEGVLINPNYKDFTISSEKLEVIALTQSELDAIINLELVKDGRLDRVRDIFLFSCATGLRYSDMQQLRREHIKDDTIELRVMKTKELHLIPLNALSARILAKYSDVINPLPMISSQKLNKYIKELCELSGINEQIEISRFHGSKKIVSIMPKYELIHIHTGRKTFCTLSLEKGMSAEEVMEISGHSDYRSFKRYVKVTEQRKKAVMLKAWGSYEPKMKVV